MMCVHACALALAFVFLAPKKITGRRFFISFVGILMRIFPFFHNLAILFSKIVIYKQLLDEVFVISRVIEDEVGVISRSRRLRLITLTETSIILDITKTERKKLKSCFCFFTNGKQHKAR